MGKHVATFKRLLLLLKNCMPMKYIKFKCLRLTLVGEKQQREYKIKKNKYKPYL